jgi:hypothetical protein
MRLYNVEPEAQNLMNDDKPVFDKSDFGNQDYERKSKKTKFNRSEFDDFK